MCLYHEVVRGLGVNVMLSFVYSEDNWAEEPSRGEYRSLLAAGGRRRPMVFPSKQLLWEMAVDFGAVESGLWKGGDGSEARPLGRRRQTALVKRR